MNTLEIEAKLAAQYKYKPLPEEQSQNFRYFFERNLPNGLIIGGDKTQPLYTVKGTLICAGYNRIVIGDYGAFIEVDKCDNLIIRKGQEYRIHDPKYSKNVKYHWYTIDDGSDIKVYYQVKGVSYADYKVGMYYISPHEVEIERK